MEENNKAITKEQEQDVKAFAELPEDVRKQLPIFGAGMLAMKKAS